MDNIKLPIALVLAMFVQLAGGVWWVSQQAATISNLEETVSQLGSRMAIEDNVNLKRDVLDNSLELEHVWDELEDIWGELASMAMTINEINKKYTVNSIADLTGCRNLTIDNAPTKPKLRAMSFEITEVIPYVIIGKPKIVKV